MRFARAIRIYQPLPRQRRFKLDTTLDYEPNIFHSYLLPFLENRSGIAPEHYRKLDELYQRLDEFFDINNTQAIPADSVVREFIGPRRESEQNRIKRGYDSR